MFFINNLVLAFTGSLSAKLKSLLIISAPAGLIAWLFEKVTSWTIANGDYIVLVLVAIVIDHILGSIFHLQIKDFEVKKNLKGLVIKISLCIAMGFLFEGINHLIAEVSIVKSYLLIVMRLAVFLYPAFSAIKNAYILSGKKFPPPALMERITKFNNTLDLDDLKGKTPQS
ncbi:phage holin family protein [Aegicerativicinus sediminis]|uniref:phage holin family protein n=1 Tax=Aegicerativicinus sediminis TaxID=2893202 RepID=UPI001E4912A5|nr:phage holin family protein [Aegicerativicinus sediminis]